MKKYILLALAAVALQTNAATIWWGLGADIYLMKPGQDPASDSKIAFESELVVDTSAYLALVCVGAGVNTFDIADISTGSVVDSMAYEIDTDNATYACWSPEEIKTTTVSASKYADGSSFAVVWFNGKSFDYIYSIDDGSAFNTATTIQDMTLGRDTIAPAENTTGWGGVIAVPEPSVALLGLLGIGMLIKRRRA